MAKADSAPFRHDDLMAEYAHLRKRKKTVPYSQEHKDAVCHLISRHFRTDAHACVYVGISESGFKLATNKETPKDPKWAAEIDVARVEAEEYWLQKGEWYADQRNNPGQKHAEFRLKSLNRDKYGDRPQDRGTGGGVNLLIMTGGAPLQIPETVVESTQPALMGSET